MTRYVGTLVTVTSHDTPDRQRGAGTFKRTIIATSKMLHATKGWKYHHRRKVVEPIRWSDIRRGIHTVTEWRKS